MSVRNVQSILYSPPAGTGQAGGISGPDSNPLQDFTTLLASEITNEDPNNPVSSTDMVSQYAEINAAVGMNQLYQSSQIYQNAETAANLLNQLVTITDPQSKETITGTVKGLDYSGTTPKINVDGMLYPLGDVTAVSAAGQ